MRPPPSTIVVVPGSDADGAVPFSLPLTLNSSFSLSRLFPRLPFSLFFSPSSPSVPARLPPFFSAAEPRDVRDDWSSCSIERCAIGLTRGGRDFLPPNDDIIPIRDHRRCHRCWSRRVASDSSVRGAGFSPGDLRDRPITWIYRISAISFSSLARVIFSLLCNCCNKLMILYADFLF